MKKNIGICTLFHKNYNYGGVLQGYALQKSIEKLGYEVSLISYDMSHSVNPIYPTLKDRCAQYTFAEILSKAFEIFIAKFHIGIKKKLDVRIKRFEKFISENMKYTEVVSDCSLHSVVSQFNALICGSDQVWNPNAVRRLFLLTMNLEKDVKRISYAASISRDGLSDREKAVMIPAISKFNYVSVREKTAAKILEDSGIKNVKVLVDPTIMVSASEWETICASRMIEKKYVFVYSFSDCPIKNGLVDYYKQENVDVFYLPFVKQQYNSFDGNTKMSPLWNVGPAEFISLIKYAEYVYTDSFHGVIFSIIFNRNFAVYERDGNGKTSKNSRIYDLLELFGLESRLIKSDFIAIKNEIIDYKEINKKIADKREEAYNWLQNAIE